MIEACQSQAERLSELLFEQLEQAADSEHQQAYILTLVARRLARRVGELGEVIESQARELDDRAALQMATALQACCASLHHILDQIAIDPRFGLLPGTELERPAAPKRRRDLQPDRGGDWTRSGEATDGVECATDQAQQ